MSVLNIIFIVVIGVAIYLFWQKRKGYKDISVPDLSQATIRDAKSGDILTIAGIGTGFEDVDFTIDRINRYESGKGKWFELMGSHGGKNIWIEWEDEDGELFITATANKKGKPLSSFGLTEELLIRFDEEGSRENSFEYNGQKFRYNYSGEAAYFENDKGEAEGFYVWDFISEANKQILSVEKWEGEPFEVFQGDIVPPYNVTVFKK